MANFGLRSDFILASHSSLLASLKALSALRGAYDFNFVIGFNAYALPRSPIDDGFIDGNRNAFFVGRNALSAQKFHNGHLSLHRERFAIERNLGCHSVSALG